MKSASFNLKQFYNAVSIPVRLFDAEKPDRIISAGCDAFDETIKLDASRLKQLSANVVPDGIPVLVFETGKLLYSVFQTKQHNLIILGPVYVLTADQPADQPKGVSNYQSDHTIQSIRYYSLDAFCALTAILFYQMTGQSVTESDIMASLVQDYQETSMSVQTRARQYISDNIEEQVHRFSYQEERTLMNLIREGRPEALTAHFKLNKQAGKVGRLAKSPYKHYEYLTCAMITLATREAIHGGLDATTAYAMSDLFEQQLENCSKIDDMLYLQRQVMMSFATRVKQLIEEKCKQSYIEKCKRYIEHHLHVPFTLDDLAREVDISKTYLSARFSEETGIGVSLYTRQKRVEAARNMLKYSDSSIAEIASYLCFSSQSYFGKVFHSITGMTPRQYRDKEKYVDII